MCECARLLEDMTLKGGATVYVPAVVDVVAPDYINVVLRLPALAPAPWFYADVFAKCNHDVVHHTSISLPGCVLVLGVGVREDGTWALRAFHDGLVCMTHHYNTPL